MRLDLVRPGNEIDDVTLDLAYNQAVTCAHDHKLVAPLPHHLGEALASRLRQRHDVRSQTFDVKPPVRAGGFDEPTVLVDESDPRSTAGDEEAFDGAGKRLSHDAISLNHPGAPWEEREAKRQKPEGRASRTARKGQQETLSTSYGCASALR